jgi:hypothetical protein
LPEIGTAKRSREHIESINQELESDTVSRRHDYIYYIVATN